MTGQLDQISSQAGLDLFNNVSLGSAGLAEGAGAHTLKTTNIINFRIGGQAYIKAATDNIAWPSLTTVIPTGTTKYYLVSIKADGNLVLTAPPAARTGDPDTTGLLLGALPANQAVIGIMKLVTTAEFTHGTTDLGGQGTFANLNAYPANGDPTGFTYA
jgi:hypothetical protein